MSTAIEPARDVKALTAANAGKIEEARTALGSDLDPDLCDDLWVLRFLLSHKGDVAAATTAIRDTLAWRRTKAEYVKCARDGTFPPHHDKISKYAPVDVHKASKEGDSLYIVRVGLSNPTALMNEVPEQAIVDWMMYKREQVFLANDAMTRKTGRLCKAITVNDMNGVSMAKMHRGFMNCLKASAKLSETMYPQLLDTAVIINLPTVLKYVIASVRPMMPKRTQEKMKLCPGATTSGDASTCPFLKARFDLASVPSFLGGSCTCRDKGGCVCGIPNDQRTAYQEVDDQGMSKFDVPARGRYEVFLNVDKAGSTLVWAMEVAKGTLSSGGLSFEAQLRVEGADPITLVQPGKAKPEDGLVKGETAVPQAGTVVLTIRNNGMFARTLRYSAAVVRIGGEGEDDSWGMDGPDLVHVTSMTGRGNASFKLTEGEEAAEAE